MILPSDQQLWSQPKRMNTSVQRDHFETVADAALGDYAEADAEELLLAVSDIIHPEVESLHPDSIPPTFEFPDIDNGFVVRYTSKGGGLLPMTQGLIQGCGALCGKESEIERVGVSSPCETQLIGKASNGQS